MGKGPTFDSGKSVRATDLRDMQVDKTDLMETSVHRRRRVATTRRGSVTTHRAGRSVDSRPAAAAAAAAAADTLSR